jgi:hypothetical protein
MAKLDLPIAMGDFDRRCALLEGTVRIEGADRACIELPVQG